MRKGRNGSSSSSLPPLSRNYLFSLLLLLLRYAAGRVERRRRHCGRYFSSPFSKRHGLQVVLQKERRGWKSSKTTTEKETGKRGERDSSNATWHEIASAATVSLLLSYCLSLATSSPLLVSTPTVLSFLCHTIRERREEDCFHLAVRRRRCGGEGGEEERLYRRRERRRGSFAKGKKERGRERGKGVERPSLRRKRKGKMLLPRCVTYGGRYTPLLRSPIFRVAKNTVGGSEEGGGVPARFLLPLLCKRDRQD